MKKVLLFLILLGSVFFVYAQVSMVTSLFSQKLSKDDLPFCGQRKLYAIGINDKNTENYFVVSKNRSGAETDELYIEKFTKTGNIFNRTFQYKKNHPVNKSLAFVENRARYSDMDKDRHYENLSIVDEHHAASKVVKVMGMIIYKNKANELWVSNDGNFSKKTF